MSDARRHGATSQVTRREFLLLGGAPLGVLASWRLAAVQDTLSGTGPAGRLFNPSWAGRPQRPVTSRDSDPGVQAIEKRLKCTCGCNLDVYTCRTTDFTCGVSPEMHGEVVALVEQGRTAEQIIDDFVARHGVAILMAPPKRGFNLAGYFVPSVAILVAGAVLVAVLRRWARSSEPAPVTPPPLRASPAELERLRAELDRLPD